MHCFHFSDFVYNFTNTLGVDVSGVCGKGKTCSTCNLNFEDCIGHFGVIDLELPVFHVGYLKSIKQVMWVTVLDQTRRLGTVRSHIKFRPRSSTTLA